MPGVESGLRRARQRNGLKQAELAVRAGISRQALSALEAGRAQPSTVMALNLARALGLRVEELFWLREEGDSLRATLASPARGARRALLGLVSGRWVAHPLRPHDPQAVVTSADALLSAGKLRLLRQRPAVESNVLLSGCDPGLAVLAGRVADRWPGQRLCWIAASSDAALTSLARGQAHVAGAHLFDEQAREFNVPFVRRPFAGRAMVVVTVA